MRPQLNDVLSLGLHRVWKRAAVKWSGAVRGHAALDVCCGSGDLAFLLAEAVGPEGQASRLLFLVKLCFIRRLSDSQKNIFSSSIIRT